METLLVVDDEADVQYSFRRIFTSPEIEILTANSGEEALALIPRAKPDLVLMDVRMTGITGLETLRRLRDTDPKLPVIIMTAYGTTQTAIEAMKLGAFDYLLKPFDVPRLQQIVAGALKAARDMRQVVSYQPLLESEDYEIGIVGRSEPMQNVFKLIGQLAASDATALLTGESGTGKELLESELFGHERGAFTGAATQRIGKFEQCNKGTLFLDEIGDMSPATQTKILRVLQDGSFERVGGNTSVKVDVRVIAATNKVLEEAVAAGKFREDLFYRLNVVRIHMPALRERREDIVLLINYFLKKFAQLYRQPPKAISPDAINALQSHDWPGNVRELENAIQRALVMAKGPAISLVDLPPEVIGKQRSLGAPPSGGSLGVPPSGGPPSDDLPALARAFFQWARNDPKRKLIPSVERELIVEALKETKGNQVQAAKLLGITRATLRKRVEKFGIKQELEIH
jgi:DNA-binding NtrC family response regulator